MNILKSLSKSVNIPIYSVCLCFFLLFGLAINASAGRTFNIQLNYPAASLDSLHSSRSASDNISKLLFSEEPVEVTYQVFDANDRLIYTGSETRWRNINNKALNLIKRDAEFLFNSYNTKIYKVFSPIKNPEFQPNPKRRIKSRSKKINNSFRKRANNHKKKNYKRKKSSFKNTPKTLALVD